jgi:hypothetical protein
MTLARSGQPRRNSKDSCCGVRLDCSTRVGRVGGALGKAAGAGRVALRVVTGTGLRTLLHMLNSR